MSDISYSEWLAELDRLSPATDPAGCRTVAEIVAATGMGRLRVREQIRRGMELGLVRQVWVTRTRIDNQPARVPAYIFTKGR